MQPFFRSVGQLFVRVYGTGRSGVTARIYDICGGYFRPYLDEALGGYKYNRRVDDGIMVDVSEYDRALRESVGSFVCLHG